MILRRMIYLVSNSSWCGKLHRKVTIKTLTSTSRTIMMLAWHVLMFYRFNHLLDLGSIMIYNLDLKFANKLIIKIKMVHMFRYQKHLFLTSHKNSRIRLCRSLSQRNYFPRGKWPNMICKSPQLSHAKSSFRELSILSPIPNKLVMRLSNLHLQIPKSPVSSARNYLKLLVS